MKLKNKTAFVTGGAVGLGKAIALRLAEDGANLVLFAPEENEINDTVSEIQQLRCNALGIVGDIRREDEIQAAVQRTHDELGPVDILVNNSAIMGPTAYASDVSLEDWNECLEINLTGAFLCSKAIAPEMEKRRSGKMINISSVAGRIGYALRSPYAVSKWGLIGLTKSLANELGEFNVQVNVICPGPIEGDRMRRVIENRAKELGQTVEEATAAYVAKSALGRMAKQEDVAAMVAFLASPETDNVTGEVIDVSAGYML